MSTQSMSEVAEDIKALIQANMDASANCFDQILDRVRNIEDKIYRLETKVSHISADLFKTECKLECAQRYTTNVLETVKKFPPSEGQMEFTMEDMKAHVLERVDDMDLKIRELMERSDQFQHFVDACEDIGEAPEESEDNRPAWMQ